MTTASDWTGTVGDSWAREVDRTDRAMGPLNRAILDALLPLLPDGAHVLDIGCGAGATSRALVERRRDAWVTGIDLSESLIAVATGKAAGNDRLTFQVADAADWPAPRRFDALMSRHGVMFFPDPVAAFGKLAALACPGAPLVFTCFRSPAENGWIQAIAPIVAAYRTGEAPADPLAPGPFAFADPARIFAILDASGFVEAAVTPFDFPLVAGEGADALEDAIGYFSRIGALAAVMRDLDADRRHAAIEDLRETLRSHVDRGHVGLPAAAWLVTARRGAEAA